MREFTALTLPQLSLQLTIELRGGHVIALGWGT
jgi:hypothetical protein